MRVVIFCRSLASDCKLANAPNPAAAQFLRGVAAELISRGHELAAYESRDGVSRGDPLELDQTLDHADLVLVHDCSNPELVRRIGRHHERSGGYRLLFHDTHHRAVTAPDELRRFDLSGFDGVLARGEVIRQLYLTRHLAARAWTWHEAADTRIFAPRPGTVRSDDLVWIGDWEDGERGAELRQMLLGPARRLSLSGVVHGARYPWRGRLAISHSGLRYGGWLANHLAPAVFARHRFTVQLSRSARGRALPGVPATRIFEALACGIPLICSYWEDAEGLFTPGRDYLVAREGREMEAAMRTITRDRATAAALSEHGRATILARHTCAHRVDELLAIDASLRGRPARSAAAELATVEANAAELAAAELPALVDRTAPAMSLPLRPRSDNDSHYRDHSPSKGPPAGRPGLQTAGGGAEVRNA